MTIRLRPPALLLSLLAVVGTACPQPEETDGSGSSTEGEDTGMTTTPGSTDMASADSSGGTTDPDDSTSGGESTTDPETTASSTDSDGSTDDTGSESGSDSSGGEAMVEFYQFGTDSSDQVFGVAVDSTGDVVLGGGTLGDFDGRPTSGFYQAFVHKVDPDGNPQWTFEARGETDSAIVEAVAVDSSNNIIAVGTDNAGPGGDWIGFVYKLDPDGNELWSTQFSIASGHDSATDVAVDSNDNIIVVGQAGFQAFARIYPPQGDDAMTAPAPTNTMLLHEGGLPGGSRFTSVFVDAMDNIYAAGWTTGELGAPNAGGLDAWFTSFTPNLAAENVADRTQYGTTSDDLAQGIVRDASGSMYMAGYTDNALGFIVDRDGWVRRYDAGVEQWADIIESSAADETHVDSIWTLTLDGLGQVIAAGETNGTVGEMSLGNVDAVVRVYDPDGTVLGTEQFGTSESDGVIATTVDTTRAPVLAGYTWGDLAGSLGTFDGFVTLPQ